MIHAALLVAAVCTACVAAAADDVPRALPASVAEGFIDVTAPPYGADPTGARDSAEAINRALDDVTDLTRRAFRQTLAEMGRLPATGTHHHPGSFENRRVDGAFRCTTTLRLPFLPVILLPAGTYLVSDTLRYRHEDLVNSYGSEMNQQIRVRGAGPDRTIIRLADGAAGFGAGARKPVLSFMRADKTNVGNSNYCENLAIDCGRGNPGAVGLDFYANNTGAVRHVRITSGDGAGFAGLQLGHGNYSGVLVKHVEIEGFDHGLRVDSSTGSMFAHAEDVRVRGQRVSGITVGAISCSLRKVRAEGVPVGLTCTSPQGLAVIVDSELSGTGRRGIDRQAGGLYASNVTLAGFADARTIAEEVFPEAVGVRDGSGMARLPIEETPVRRKLGGAPVGVRRFGAIGNGANDDAPAIQRAFDSGAAAIRFEPGRYLIDAPIRIPAHVEHVDFGFCDLVAGADLAASDREGFLIEGGEGEEAAALPPLFVERLVAWEQWSGLHCSFTHASRRTVCFADMQTQGLRFYRNTVPAGRVFFDNVATTTGVRPGAEGHGRCAVALIGQKAWARQLNPERGEPMILNDGGDLVLLGYKSEDMGVVLRTVNGGRSEVLGGVVNCGREGRVAFEAENAAMRISTATFGWLEGSGHRTQIRHVRGGEEIRIDAADLPSRGFPASQGRHVLIPLYR